MDHNKLIQIRIAYLTLCFLENVNALSQQKNACVEKLYPAAFNISKKNNNARNIPDIKS